MTLCFNGLPFDGECLISPDRSTPEENLYLFFGVEKGDSESTSVAGGGRVAFAGDARDEGPAAMDGDEPDPSPRADRRRGLS